MLSKLEHNNGNRLLSASTIANIFIITIIIFLINTGLHIIIFDEIDAICKARGSSGGESSGVNDAFIRRFQLSNLLLR